MQASTRKPILGVVPTPPAFEVPRNACDCHTHIFGPVGKFPFSPKRLYTPGDASIEDLEALHRALHIDRVETELQKILVDNPARLYQF